MLHTPIMDTTEQNDAHAVVCHYHFYDYASHEIYDWNRHLYDYETREIYNLFHVKSLYTVK